MSIPRPEEPLISGSTLSVNWYRFLRDLALAENASATDLAELTAEIATALGSPDGTLAGIPAAGLSIMQGAGISIAGTDPKFISLSLLEDSGEGALLAITRDSYGRVVGTKDATITGTAGEIEVADGDAVAGLPTLSLADVADAGGGTLQKTDFDTKGRKTGSSSATAADLPYDNTASGLAATDVQAALDEVATAGGGGSGDVVGPASSTNNALALFDTTTGKLLKQGANTDAIHNGTLEVWRDDGTQADIFATTYGVNGGGILHGRSANGTRSSPTGILSGQIFGGVGSRAYHSGGAFQTSSPTSIHWVASENQTATAFGSYLRILTTPKGSTTRQERLIVADSGTVIGVGNGTFDWRVAAQTKPTADVVLLATASGTAESVAVGAFTYGTGTAGFRAGAASGTAASPTATATGRILSFMGGHGHDGVSWSTGTKALLAFYSAENWSTGAQGTYITFETTPTGSTTRAEAMRVMPAGELNLTAAVPRILADMSNATLANRLAFQTNVNNSNTSLSVLPSGTGTVASINFFGGSTTTNIDHGQIAMVGSIEFRIHSSKVGAGTARPLTFYIDSTEAARFDTSRNFRPGSDNAYTLGSSSFRWSTVYAGTGAINTSDAREKTEVQAFTEAEIAAASELSREIGTFRFLSAIDAKGDAARTHVGMTVQRAIEIMQSHGLDPFDYAFICYDEWAEVSEPAVYEQQVLEAAVFVDHPALIEEWEVVEEVASRKGKHKVQKARTQKVIVKDAWREEVIPAVMTDVLVKEAFYMPAGDRYGFRMDQLLAFIARGFDARLARLESTALRAA